MHQMNKKNIENYIFSLKNSNGGFYLQKNFNQTTLMSSAFSIITLELVDSLYKIEISKEQNYFLKYQDEKTGFFVDPNLKLDYKKIEDIELNYIHYQTTAFSVSALDALGMKPKYDFTFLNAFRGKEKISKFFEKIDWRNPWHESNKIMFLLQFFSYEYIVMKKEDSLDDIHTILDCLDSAQDSKTGLWGTQFKASSFASMAAAYHFLIFYKYFNRKINFSEKISSSVFQLQMRDGLFHPFGGGGACEDLDAIDVIYKISSEVSTESKESLKRAYRALLQNYDKNGGFCWAKRPTFPFLVGLKYFNPSLELFNVGMIKWIIKNNYLGSLIPFFKEKKIYEYSNWNLMKYRINLSDSWSTWFRLLSIATIERLLPELKKHDIDYKFRRLPSIGWMQSE
jgi:prenyltransferase beta subunit